MLLLSPLLIVTTLLTATPVLADTEIRNFALPLTFADDPLLNGTLPPAWYPQACLSPGVPLTLKLSNSNPDRLLYLLPTGAFTHDAQDLLDSDSDSGSGSVSPPAPKAAARTHWTARVSWPASQPARIDMHIFPAAAYGGADDSAAVLWVHASKLTPRMDHSRARRWVYGVLGWDYEGEDVDVAELVNSDAFETTVNVLFEPLLLGVVPETAKWTIVYGVVAVLLGSFVLTPLVWRVIGWALRRVDEDEARERAGAKSKDD